MYIVNNNEEIITDPTKKKFNKGIIAIIASVLLIVIGVIFLLTSNNKSNNTENGNEGNLKPLPLPEVTGGERGQLGIDKNINESNIDEYLNRSDSVYRDMRMLDDPAQYENIGGDRFLSGYIKGFEVIPLPYIVPVEGLPEVVGSTYSGKTLFGVDENGNYVPNYEESLSIIEELFPKDKVIFLMCGGGGYAGMTKAFLVSLGWDETKIYNIGGYWYYEGKNDIKVNKTEDGYDFSTVPYHEIKFDELKEIKKEIELPIYIDDKYYNNASGKGIEELNLYEYKSEYTAFAGTDKATEIEEKIDNKSVEYGKKINQMLDNKESFVILLTNGDFCYSSIEGEVSLENNILALAKENDLYIYNIGLKIYKNSRLFEKVKYAPSVMIIYKGEILAYTDAESNDDLKYSNSKEDFNKWFTSYVRVKK